MMDGDPVKRPWFHEILMTAEEPKLHPMEIQVF
jgi:hypothetical protein